MNQEQALAINPIVQESVQRNTRVSFTTNAAPNCFSLLYFLSVLILYSSHYLSLHKISFSHRPNVQTITNIRNLTASLFGIAAGTLGLESYVGFLFYAAGTLFVSLLIYLGPAQGKPELFFYSPGKGVWMSNVFGGLMSFVLTWTVFYGVVGAY